MHQAYGAVELGLIKDLHLMHMLCTLFFNRGTISLQDHTVRTTQVQHRNRHITGAQISLADYLSRNELYQFHTKHGTTSCHPFYIPPKLLQWFLEPWTSNCWTQQLDIFVNRYSLIN